MKAGVETLLRTKLQPNTVHNQNHSKYKTTIIAQYVNTQNLKKSNSCFHSISLLAKQ